MLSVMHYVTLLAVLSIKRCSMDDIIEGIIIGFIGVIFWHIGWSLAAI